MRVSELTGALLDYWVARAEGWKLEESGYRKGEWAPSTNWAQGGPVIEREVIDLGFSPEYGYVEASIFAHGPGPGDVELVGQAKGYSPLVAAMRAYVASKFGDDVPDEPAA